MGDVIKYSLLCSSLEVRSAPRASRLPRSVIRSPIWLTIRPREDETTTARPHLSILERTKSVFGGE